MGGMFAGALFATTAFDQDISSWDVSLVTNMRSMFASAAAFNQDIGSWDVSSVSEMGFMFDNAAAFNQDLSDWNVAEWTGMQGMFDSNFNQDFRPAPPSPLPSGNHFADLAALSTAVNACIAAVPSGIGCYAANNDICGAGVNCGEIGTWDVSAVTSMLELFKHKAAFNADISEWNTAAVTNMGGMFAGRLFATTAFDQDISSWDVS